MTLIQKLFVSVLLLFPLALSAKGAENVFLPKYENEWTKAPIALPDRTCTDSPLLGNGDLLATFGYRQNEVCFYLGQNSFWQLKNQAKKASPRLVSRLYLSGTGAKGAAFTAKQSIFNGRTHCRLKSAQGEWKMTTWVAATENTLVIELVSTFPSTLQWKLSVPKNEDADLKTEKRGEVTWLSRAFIRDVDIPNESAIAIKTMGANGNTISLKPNRPIRLILTMESLFKTKNPSEEAIRRCQSFQAKDLNRIRVESDQWWREYWKRSSVRLSNETLMKGYYQGLYTLGACCRDQRFPPGIFGWITADNPAWEGDYHMNYNHLSPFMGLASSNRLEQARTQDTPLLDFMEKGKSYAKSVTRTRGILYPVGIGPCGIDTTWNDPTFVDENGNPRHYKKWKKDEIVENRVMLWQQRSNAAFNVVNMNQYWHCTLDPEYGRKIYPYVREVVIFWEDYLKLEEGHYHIYRDSICEACGWQKNPGLSLGMIRCAVLLALELSQTLDLDAQRRAKWQDLRDRLVPYPTKMINGKKCFIGGFYTLNSVFPGSVIDLDSDSELLQTAVNTAQLGLGWFAGNCSSIAFGCAVRLNYDRQLVWDKLTEYCGKRMYPNGFLLNNPHGIENSSTVHNAVNEMLCMSVGNVIRPFVGLPDGENAEFDNLRAWGAFLVSGTKINGRVSRLNILSEKGSPCVIVNPWPKNEVQLVRNGKNAELLSGKRLSFKTAENEEIKLIPKL